MKFCNSCTKPQEYIQELKVSNIEWFEVDQVKEICEQCYQNMLRNNISRVKKEILIAALKRNAGMLLNEIVWVYSGPDADKKIMNFHGRSLHPNQPIYLDDAELPM